MTEKELVTLGNESSSEPTLMDVLKLVSPGTALRTALDGIQRARLGALIAIENPAIEQIVEGGFKVNAAFTPQKLIELAKMDGAMILSSDMRTIVSANTLLFPSVHIPTKETGTRHMAAERAAKQTRTMVIAISERQNKITLYTGDVKFAFRDSSEVLRRAAETLQILEKQKESFDEALMNLNILEVTNAVTVGDVCSVLQKAEVIKKIAALVKLYLVELGNEGTVVSMRLRELIKGVDREKEYILNDYLEQRAELVKTLLEDINFDALIESSTVAKLLFGTDSGDEVSSKGIRLISKLGVSDEEVQSIVSTFKTLPLLLEASEEQLQKVFSSSSEAAAFTERLNQLKEHIVMGKKI